MFLDLLRTMSFPRSLARRLKLRAEVTRSRRLRLETLDARAMMAVLPYGAMPDDTGEFMLGDVYVNVVLVESDASKPTIFGGQADTSTEDWTASEISDVKAKITEGLDWWKQTLYEQFPKTPPDLLKFDIDFTYADNPFHTGYEAIRRASDDFQYWVSDFLSQVGFSQGGNWSAGMHAFNHSQRVAHGAEWAFTIFVVDNSNDLQTDTVTPGGFAAGGSFTNAFAYAGGRFLVMPASRPASTVAHETGHMFWALDEYSGAGDYQSHRGYYDTPNANAANNPEFNPDNPQKPSIMSNSSALNAAFTGNTSSPSTLAMIGWQDQDDDGIMDVLDVPFSLQGDGWYDDASGEYNFYGRSSVRTLQNRNPSGLQNDITINHIREAQVKIDDASDWQVIATYDDASAYSALLDLKFPLDPGQHTIRIRTYDTRTHVASDEFVGYTSTPSSISSGGISGFVWYDQDYDGVYDSSEQPNVDFGVELVDAQGHVLNLRKTLTPSQLAPETDVNSVLSGATASAVGFDVEGNEVVVMRSPISGQNVFGTYQRFSMAPVTTWDMTERNLRFDFDQATTTVSLTAIGARMAPSFARLDAYNAAGQLVGRTTSAGLGLQQDQTLTVNRSSGDIKYVIARVFQTGLVEFSDLAWGPLGSGTTNFLGAFSFPYLPNGSYYVRPIAPPLHISTTQAGNTTFVDLSQTDSALVNFGYVLAPNPWHNPFDAFDVNADGFTNVRDATQIIAWLRRHPGQADLSGLSAGESANYLDVNYDGLGNVADALAVIRQLRRQGAQQAGGEDSSAPAAPAAEISSWSPAGYFNGQPIHFDQLAADDDDHHHDDEVVAPAATDQPSLMTPVEPVALDLSPATAANVPEAAPTSAPLSLFWNLFSSNTQAGGKKNGAASGVIDLLAEDELRRS